MNFLPKPSKMIWPRSCSSWRTVRAMVAHCQHLDNIGMPNGDGVGTRARVCVRVQGVGGAGAGAGAGACSTYRKVEWVQKCAERDHKLTAHKLVAVRKCLVHCGKRSHNRTPRDRM